MNKAIFLLLSLLWALFSQAKSNELVACIDDHPPYQYLGKNPHGLHITALKTLSNVLETDLKFVQSPNFARCVAMLKKGDIDVIAGLNPTAQRSKFAFYAPFKAADTLKIISKKGISINSFEDFKGKIIGVSRGEVYFPRFDNDDSLDKISVQNSRIGFSLLLKDRIDLIMISQVKLEALKKEIQNVNLNISPIALSELRNKKTFFGFSKLNKLNFSNKELVKIITNAYEQGVFK